MPEIKVDQTINPALEKHKDGYLAFNAEPLNDAELDATFDAQTHIVAHHLSVQRALYDLSMRRDAERIGKVIGTEGALAWLGNLLAVIHRDGGHYVEQHGWVKAAKDAEAIVLELRNRSRTWREFEHASTTFEADARKLGAEIDRTWALIDKGDGDDKPFFTERCCTLDDAIKDILSYYEDKTSRLKNSEKERESAVALATSQLHEERSKHATTQRALDKFMGATADQTIQIMEMRSELLALRDRVRKDPLRAMLLSIDRAGGLGPQRHAEIKHVLGERCRSVGVRARRGTADEETVWSCSGCERKFLVEHLLNGEWPDHAPVPEEPK